MGSFTKLVAVVLIGLVSFKCFIEARSVEPDAEQRQLLNVLPSWLARLRNSLPTILNGRVSLVRFELFR